MYLPNLVMHIKYSMAWKDPNQLLESFLLK